MIQPLKQVQKIGYVPKPQAHILLHISLSKDYSGSAIANWLKVAPPDGVTAVAIEAVVTKARRLQGISSSNSIVSGSILSRTSSRTQHGIL